MVLRAAVIAGLREINSFGQEYLLQFHYTIVYAKVKFDNRCSLVAPSCEFADPSCSRSFGWILSGMQSLLSPIVTLFQFFWDTFVACACCPADESGTEHLPCAAIRYSLQLLSLLQGALWTMLLRPLVRLFTGGAASFAPTRRLSLCFCCRSRRYLVHHHAD